MQKKLIQKMITAGVACVMAVLCAFSVTAFAATTDNEIIILFTNDTHCGIEDNMGFSGVKAYKDEMEALYGEDVVTLIDAGDAVQGGPLGTLTDGEALIEIMNAVGYDYVAPGNHEYDYGIEQFFYLMDSLDATVISCNFVDLSTGTTPFAGYAIQEYNGTQVAYVGITTPETFTSSNPTNFQDEDGNYVYSFSEDTTGEALYSAVQSAVDAAIADGADYVIAIGHMGTDESIWSSLEVIANTSGIDVFVDGHSHSVIDGEEVTNEVGDLVILSQAGTKFQYLGKITINVATDDIAVELISGLSNDENAYTGKSEAVSALIDEINAAFDLILNEVVAYTSVDLVTEDEATGERIVRMQETNMGDLIADAYRVMLDADVAIMNGGGIRANIPAGDITYGDIIEVLPYSNELLSVAVTGQALLDALEFGAVLAPEENSSFMQVSGMNYTIDTTIASSVQVDEYGNFVSVDGAYRVSDVMVGDEPLDLEAMYTVASHSYYLLSYGDGMTMFEGAAVVTDTGIVDNELFIYYILEYLGGEVGEEYYAADGQDRVTMITADTVAEETTDADTDVQADVTDQEVTEEADVAQGEAATGNGTVTVVIVVLGVCAVGGGVFVRKKHRSAT